MKNDANQQDRQPGDVRNDVRNDVRIPVIEEIPQVKKEVVETGSVRVKKTVKEEVVQVPLLIREEEYKVERVPINRYVDGAPPAIRHEGKTTIISVMVEEAVIQKRLKIIEEVRITSVVKESVRQENISLRKENVIVEHDDKRSNNQS
jgi:stress response protein YsnF